MARLSPVSFNDLVKKLRKFGFQGPYGGGKHLYMVKNTLRLTIPNPHRQVIGVALLSRILNIAKITRDEWLKV